MSNFKLLILIVCSMCHFTACAKGLDEPKEEEKPKEKATMKISVTSNGKITVFELNDSEAAKGLYNQLSMNIAVEDYGGIEKIFYPPKKLNTENVPLVRSAKVGTLAYYAPWSNVVMFYGNFGSASGLYELGFAVSGGENIKYMSGTIQVKQYE